MLTEVKAYSSWHSAPVVPLDPDGRAETDLIQIRNINGLDPVKASVSMTELGSIDGSSYAGGNVATRNIVLTLRPNPDWKDWTYENIRQQLIYSYFIPKRPIRLVLYGEELPPVEISGIIESVETNLFSKDPEINVSIICPDPYFTTHDPIVKTGKTIQTGGVPTSIQYDGNMEAGIYLKVSFVNGQPPPTSIAIQIQNPSTTYFAVSLMGIISSTTLFELSSVSLKKFVQNVSISNGVITNIISSIAIRTGSLWPILQSGNNDVSVITDAGAHDWELRYYERFGGL